MREQPDAVRDIETGQHDYYVLRAGGAVEVIVAKSGNGNKYLKTEPDGEQPNNLLELPECP